MSPENDADGTRFDAPREGPRFGAKPANISDAARAPDAGKPDPNLGGGATNQVGEQSRALENRPSVDDEWEEVDPASMAKSKRKVAEQLNAAAVEHEKIARDHRERAHRYVLEADELENPKKAEEDQPKQVGGAQLG